MEKTQKRCVTVQEVAFDLGVSDRHVYDMISEGLLEAYDISISGRKPPVPQSIRVSVVSVREFKKNRRIDPGGSPQ